MTSAEIEFATLAFRLLEIEGLPLPRLDGHEGHPYLDSGDFQRLANIVCECVPGATVRDWRESSTAERVEMMRVAVHKFEPPTGSKSGNLPAEGTAFQDEASVPAEFREGGKIEGKILTTPYLKSETEWDLKGPYLTKNYGEGKPLTTHIKFKRMKAYLFKELSALRRIKTDKQSAREKEKS